MNDNGMNSFCSSGDCASCGGGCGSEFDLNEHRTVTLTMDDDTEVECAILTVFPVEDRQYIALLPLDQDGQTQQGEVYLYTFAVSPTGEPVLANIEDDDEYDRAAGAFDAIVANAQVVATTGPAEEE